MSALTHKFVDDMTLYEIVSKGTVSEMQQAVHAVDAVSEWSHFNHMNMNCKKTKEMMSETLSKESVRSLVLNKLADTTANFVKCSVYNSCVTDYHS